MVRTRDNRFGYRVKPVIQFKKGQKQKKKCGNDRLFQNDCIKRYNWNNNKKRQRLALRSTGPIF